MAATIKIKNSSTAGAAPTSSDLVQGELAVNVTDKRLYTENASGTVVELGTNPSVPVTFPDGSASAPSLTNDGDTNTGLFFPAADTIALTTGGTERLRLDSSGNLGFGITPSAWGTTTLKAIQMGGGALALSSGGAGAGDGSLTWNGYYNGTNWIYVYTGGAASRFRLNESGAAWFTSASGTAGNTITFTQAMTLDASGNLGTNGQTSPGTFQNAGITIGTGNTNYGVNIYSSSSAFGDICFAKASSGVGLYNGMVRYSHSSDYMSFWTASTERARIDSNGYFKCLGMWNLTGASAANLYSDNTGQIYRSTSALKYKQDIRDLETIDINLFRAVRYKSKCEMDDQTIDHFGIVADEVAEAGITELVNYGSDGEVEGFQYERLTVVLLKAIQELKAEFDAYKAAHP